MEGNLSFAKLKAMYTNAIAKGCDGTLVFTKNNTGDNYANASNSNNLVTDLEFISTKLPEIDKSLNGVLPVSRKYADYRRYNGTELTAAVGEYLYFTITITLDLPSSWVQVNEADSRQSTLEFTTAELIDDVLPGAYFYTKDQDKNYDGVIDEQDEGFQSSWIQTTQDIHEALNADWTDEEIEAGKRVLEYFVVYPLTGKDIDKDIVNTVEFKYEYTSRYSGAAESAAHAAGADIHVVGAYMDNVVVDFGQSVSIPDTDGKLGFANVKSTECEYGKITITQNEGGTYTLTYTPTCILQDEDHVILYDKDHRSINSFFVIPATTVYYEEGFAFPAITNSDHMGDWDMTTGSWDLTNSKTATVQQTLEMLNGSQQDSSVSNKLYPYGYDPIYNTAAPNGSYAETHTIGDKTRFTFTGDGIQIFANCLPCTDAGCDHKACTSTSGYVSVEVREAVAPYKIVRLAMVNTKVLAGSTEATSGQVGEMNGLPVVSLINLQNMPHGKYIVTIAKIMNTNPVYIEGFRVFNTVKPDPDISPFTIDYEDQPKFYELRDAVLYAVGTNVDGNVEGATEDYVGKVTQQIYDAVQGASAVIIDPEVPYAGSETLQDLLDKGPKNELFLYDGQTLTFKVTTDRCMQVGLKSPQGAVPVVITVAKDSAAPTTINKTINSSVDMFYDLVDRPIETPATYTITITNVDDCDAGANDILSVTLLKICDDPNAAFTQLTQGDIENILTGANAPIRIISQPADTEVKMGERFNVEVIAEGDGLKYQWYFRNAGSSTFQKSGVKDNTYDDVMTAARAGREIYCVITDAQGNSVTTETATLIALPETELAIMSQPNDSSAKMGERFCVTVEAQGDGLRYTWYWRTKGTEKWNKSGVTDNTYDDVMTVSRHNREVYCVITDVCGNTVQSEIATITRLPDVSLAITQQPTDANASMGERFCVTVEAQGDGLRYTWYFKNAGTDVWHKSGVTDNTYDDVMNKSRAGREIYCVITDVCGNTVTTVTVTLVCTEGSQLVTAN